MRRLLLSMAAAGCVFTASAAWQMRDHSALSPGAVQAQTAPTPSDIFKLVWSQPIVGFRSAALSPDGSHIAVVAGRINKVSLWDWQKKPYKPLWSRPTPGTDNAAVSAGGGAVLAFSGLDPTERAVVFLNGKTGQAQAHNELDGAIWDAVISSDGHYAGLATGNRSLYLYTLEDRPRYHRWPLGGIGTSLAITQDSTFLTTGTWDESGVACYTLTGTPLWQYPQNPQLRHALNNRLFQAQIAQNGRYILGLSYANAHQSNGTLYFWRRTGSGRPLWTHELGPNAFYPKAEISADGRFVAVTYQRLISHNGGQSAAERRLLLLDSLGNTVWEKGGMLFSPNLVALSPDGRRLTVSDGRKTLYNLDGNGREVASYNALHGLIRQIVLSDDKRFLLIYTGDGALSLLRVG